MFFTQNQFDKNAIMDALIAAIEDNFQDFSPIQQTYIQTMDHLQIILGAETVQKEKDAICQEVASTILFSCVLGIQANYQYFSNPVSGNFLDMEPEIYLRENISKYLPEYTAAQEIRSEFYSQLNAEQKELYGPVTEYISYLETVGPKLAHYYGFLMGNELLSKVVPGYHPDMAFALQYCIRLERYFGNRLDLSRILKSTFSIA